MSEQYYPDPDGEQNDDFGGGGPQPTNPTYRVLEVDPETIEDTITRIDLEIRTLTAMRSLYQKMHDQAMNEAKLLEAQWGAEPYTKVNT